MNIFNKSYDVIVTLGPEEVLAKFKSLSARVVFGAEDFCWPDINLKVASLDCVILLSKISLKLYFLIKG